MAEGAAPLAKSMQYLEDSKNSKTLNEKRAEGAKQVVEEAKREYEKRSI